MESGRIRFTEYSGASFQGFYAHYNGSTNLFHIGVHNTNDQLSSNDINALSIRRETGFVGIGMDPLGTLYRLDVAGSTRVSGNLRVTGDLLALGHFWLHAWEGDGTSGTAYIQARDESGSSSIGLQFRTQLNGNWRDAMRLSPEGNVTVNVIEIRGGSDLAETFDVIEHPEPGMLVSIDPTHEGKLCISKTPYDKKVAGIISGAGGVNTGLKMGQESTLAHGEFAVALTGRVYCWVDASHDEIQPGDLLTTSSTPGYAMKVRDSSQAQGAIIGKAMTPLKEKSKGLVLVLVSLQ
ncbi:MAG: hypothetical protein HC842_01640 [Cytophagales bacterium]|nr:hypothetical protein [Cytophagales bacterium]